MKALRYIIAGVVIVPLLIAVTCSFLPNSTLPPILRNLTASGHSYCPVPKDLPEIAKPKPVAPTEFDKRLAHEYPPGTSEASVVSSLKSLGFEVDGACKEDNTIRYAHYLQRGVGLVSLGADVFWKVDAKREIVWIRGSVSYTGP